VVGFLGQVDKVFIDDAAHAVARAVDALDVAEAPRLQRHAHQGLVDDGGGAAALGDEYFSGCHGGFPLFLRVENVEGVIVPPKPPASRFWRHVRWPERRRALAAELQAFFMPVQGEAPGRPGRRRLEVGASPG
jgi:hypothetical protein